MMYMIWSNEHRAWWAPHARGYTKDVTEAGFYKRDEAVSICRQALMSSAALGMIAEVPVPAEMMADVIAGTMVPGCIFGKEK